MFAFVYVSVPMSVAVSTSSSVFAPVYVPVSESFAVSMLCPLHAHLIVSLHLCLFCAHPVASLPTISQEEMPRQ